MSGEPNTSRRTMAAVVFRLGAGKRTLLVGASLALTYVVALVTFMIRWMHFWMRGPYFVSYLAVFFCALALLLFWWTTRHHDGPLPFFSTVAYSVVAGYVAGVFWMVLYPLFQTDGVHGMLEGLRFPTLEAAVAFFWFPVRLVAWMFGGIAGGMMVLLSRRWRRMKPS
jgi:hypothetical protein